MVYKIDIITEDNRFLLRKGEFSRLVFDENLRTFQDSLGVFYTIYNGVIMEQWHYD